MDKSFNSSHYSLSSSYQARHIWTSQNITYYSLFFLSVSTYWDPTYEIPETKHIKLPCQRGQLTVEGIFLKSPFTLDCCEYPHPTQTITSEPYLSSWVQQRLRPHYYTSSKVKTCPDPCHNYWVKAGLFQGPFFWPEAQKLNCSM